MNTKVRPECSVSGCAEPNWSRTYCRRHYKHWYKYGDANYPVKVYRPRGTGTIDQNGYIYVCKDGRKAFEHVFVMESLLGRRLFKGETVHHKNGIRSDNRAENLELRASAHGPGQRVEDLVLWAKEIIQKYGDLS